jgi:hypothetical protein
VWNGVTPAAAALDRIHEVHADLLVEARIDAFRHLVAQASQQAYEPPLGSGGQFLVWVEFGLTLG